MPSRWQSDDDFDDDELPYDELGDHEAPDEPDDADDEAATVTCAYCGAQAYEFAEFCPHCGELLTRDTRVWSGRSWVWTALGLAGVLAVILVILYDHGILRLNF